MISETLVTCSRNLESNAVMESEAHRGYCSPDVKTQATTEHVQRADESVEPRNAHTDRSLPPSTLLKVETASSMEDTCKLTEGQVTRKNREVHHQEWTNSVDRVQ